MTTAQLFLSNGYDNMTIVAAIKSKIAKAEWIGEELLLVFADNSFINTNTNNVGTRVSEYK